MAIRSMGPSAGFGWLGRGIGVGFRHPMPLFGGAALMAVAALIPTLITLPVQLHALRSGTALEPTTVGWMMALSMLFGLLLIPLYAGYMQLVYAAEEEFDVSAFDIIKPYREGKALRLIGYGLAMLVIYFVVFGIIFAITGGDIAQWYMGALTAQLNHQPPPTTLPHGFGITLLLCVVIGIFIIGVYSISLGQITLRNRSVFGAIGDGIIGALKNLLPLLMLALGLLLTWIGVAIGFGITALLLALIGKLIGAWFVFVLIVPLYIALLLVAFSAMFGVMYHLWLDVCGDDIEMGAAETVAV
jgi:hypothetical protein